MTYNHVTFILELSTPSDWLIVVLNPRVLQMMPIHSRGLYSTNNIFKTKKSQCSLVYVQSSVKDTHKFTDRCSMFTDRYLVAGIGSQQN